MNVLETQEGMTFLDLITYPGISLQQGEFVFLTGESGCGKSTFLKLCNRTVLPRKGTFSFEGKEVSAYPVLEYRKQVVLAPQQVFLFPGSIEDSFLQYEDFSQREKLSRDEMRRYLSLCCADLPLQTDVTQLSGGERQRVFLAIFLSTEPKLLLLDEPTAALDEKTSKELLGNIKRYCKEKGITVLCVCHSKELVEQFADREIHLEKQHA